MLCPFQVLHRLQDVQWLGLPWHPQSKIPFARLHQNGTECSNPHPLVHIGKHYFLSLTDQTVTFKNTINELQIRLSPLNIYNFPCSVQIPKAGIDDCPDHVKK